MPTTPGLTRSTTSATPSVVPATRTSWLSGSVYSMADRGNAEFDIRHRFAISGIWNVPLFKGSDLRDQDSGWLGVAADLYRASGSPYSIYDCTNAYNFCERAETAGTVPQGGVTQRPHRRVFPTTTSSTHSRRLLPRWQVHGTTRRLVSATLVLIRPTSWAAIHSARPGIWNLNLGIISPPGSPSMSRSNFGWSCTTYSTTPTSSSTKGTQTCLPSARWMATSTATVTFSSVRRSSS